MKNTFKVRVATKKDAKLILFFIRALATFEKLRHEVKATTRQIEQTLFGRKKFAEVLIAFEGQTPIGFALFFHNYSTFLGKPGIYLEDLFILPQYRSSGYGKKLLEHIFQLAKKRKCGRVEWSVLNWNQRAQKFYVQLGAQPMKAWTVYRYTQF